MSLIVPAIELPVFLLVMAAGGNFCTVAVRPLETGNLPKTDRQAVD